MTSVNALVTLLDAISFNIFCRREGTCFRPQRSKVKGSFVFSPYRDTHEYMKKTNKQTKT